MEHSQRCRERFLLLSYYKQHLEPPHAVGRLSGNNACPLNKIRRQSTTKGTVSLLPRHVHVYLLHYTEKLYIPRNAMSVLKDNPFLEANLYISDDVSKKVRDNRKKLKERYIIEIRSQEEVDFANIKIRRN